MKSKTKQSCHASQWRKIFPKPLTVVQNKLVSSLVFLGYSNIWELGRSLWRL